MARFPFAFAQDDGLLKKPIRDFSHAQRMELEHAFQRVLPTLQDAGYRRPQPPLYRYAWAQRARAACMREREAMNALGHESRAVHAAYAGGAQVVVSGPARDRLCERYVWD